MSEDWATEVNATPTPDQTRPIELTGPQSVRMLAVQMATSTLGQVRAGLPVSAESIILLADYILGDPETDEILADPDAMDGIREALDESFADLLADLTGRSFTMTDIADLKVGDQVAADGDTLVEEPVLNEDSNEWTLTIRCPQQKEPFTITKFGNGQMPVFAK